MKGLIFNGFLEFVEHSMSYDMVDKIIIKSNLPSDGVYTSIGTYNPQEIFTLVSTLSGETGIAQKTLLIDFGEYLFGIFVTKYPRFFKHKTTVFQFLSQVDSCIHVEVKKFYTDADLPSFKCNTVDPNKLIMIYQSSRPLADLAEGLIKGCIRYHHEKIAIIRKDINVKQGAKCQFLLIRRNNDEPL